MAHTVSVTSRQNFPCGWVDWDGGKKGEAMRLSFGEFGCASER